MLPKPSEIIERFYSEKIFYQDSPSTTDVAYPFDVVQDMLTKAIEQTKESVLLWASKNAKVKEFEKSKGWIEDKDHCDKKDITIEKLDKERQELINLLKRKKEWQEELHHSYGRNKLSIWIRDVEKYLSNS